MKALKILAVGAVVALPMLTASLPARAITSHQYMAQGHGNYVSSKERVRGTHFHRRYHRWHRR